MRRAMIVDALALLTLATLALAVWRLWWLGAFTDSNDELTPSAAETVSSLSHAACLAVYAAMAVVLVLWITARWLIHAAATTPRSSVDSPVG